MYRQSGYLPDSEEAEVKEEQINVSSNFHVYAGSTVIACQHENFA